MHVQDLDPTDPVALEAALEAAPVGTSSRVETADGEDFIIYRVPGGWYLPGDVVVASGDVADGRPHAISLLVDPNYRGDLFGEDPYDEEDGR